MSDASRLDCRKVGVMAASVVGLTALSPAARPEDEVLVESHVVFDERMALLAPAGASSLDRLVLRVKAIVPEMVSPRGWFRDEQPEIILVFGLSEERAEAVKAYLVSRGIDPYRVRVEAAPLRADGLPNDRRVTIRLVTLPGQKSLGSSGKAGLRFPR